jgi:hypothetical protein
MSLAAFKRFPVRATEDVRDIASRFVQLPPMLLWVDPNDNDTNTRIQNAITGVTHKRRDSETTTLLRCRADRARTGDVWTQPLYCLQADEPVTVLRKNAPGEQDFAFIRTASGVQGFVLVAHLANSEGAKITRVSSTAEALAAIQGDLQKYISLPPSRFRVMTNCVRMEDGARNFNAGPQMAHEMRLLVSLFCSTFPTMRLNLILSFSRATVDPFSSFAQTLIAQPEVWREKRTCCLQATRKPRYTLQRSSLCTGCTALPLLIQCSLISTPWRQRAPIFALFPKAKSFLT